MRRTLFTALILIISSVVASAQVKKPSSPAGRFIVYSGQQVVDLYKELEKQDGNKQSDVVAQAGNQMRVAVFHDEKRENDMHEVHDTSDDIYYVLEGEATLVLGGKLVEPKEISPGEWRSKESDGGSSVTIRKGDLIVVPRGTPHQRTVTGKGFSMILIKVFAEQQP